MTKCGELSVIPLLGLFVEVLERYVELNLMLLLIFTSTK